MEGGDRGFWSNDYVCMSVVTSSILRSTVDYDSAAFRPRRSLSGTKPV